MSTTFAIFNIPVETNENGEITSYYEDNNYVEIAYRRREINFIEPFNLISHAFLKECPVYPLDNTAQGIYTIYDIIREVDYQFLKELRR